jgi:hypothetical protein
MTEAKPLQPLTHGNILIVGAKNSNFDEEILTHPRVIIWSSQQEHWSNKDLPSNVRAVFVTRWIGHTAFARIIGEARKRHITMFNPEGTGQIARQVKELLALNNKETEMATVHIDVPQTVKYDRSLQVKNPNQNSKLHVFLPYIDWNKSNTANANELFKKAEELGITTTLPSLANYIGVQRKKITGKGLKNTHPVTPKTKTVKVHKADGLDVSVQMLDDAIQSMKDMREFLVATVNENNKLRARLDMFKKALAE